MHETLGEKLIREGLVTEDQVGQALLRQKLHGGRLGSNLAAMGFISETALNAYFNRRPPIPKTVADTGLTLEFICELTLKIMFYLGSFSMFDITDRLKLPVNIVDAAIQQLRNDRFCEVKGGTGYERITYQFTISSAGRQRALELMEKNHYVGPAPVTLDDYTQMSEYQTIRNVFVSEAEIRRVFAPFVISDRVLNQLGPAVNSGKSIFLYGPPGNGKTVIAETIGSLMGEDIFIPHSVCIEYEMIRVYDPINHQPAGGKKQAGQAANAQSAHDADEEDYDKRWVLCRRPVVLVGGELTLGMLDLDFNPISKYYEAPFQMKANGGVFIVDDFGRQMVRPRDLLNRWIVPLERRSDFLTLHTGKKFEIPFDQLVVFSTNIEPRELVDDAFLRRIRYKVKIDHPEKADYKEIFLRICNNNGIDYDDSMVEYLLDNYEKTGVKLNACHPRDIVDQIIDIARYRNTKPALDRDLMDDAWYNYFVEI